MTDQYDPAERDARDRADARTDADCTRRRVLAGSAAVLGTLGVAGATGPGIAGAAGGQSGGPSVSVEFADAEVDAGETTRLELVLSEVPDEGLTGWTFFVELVGSGSAGFTGEGEFSDSMGVADIDTDNTDSDSAAYLNGANMGGVQAGDENILIGDVVVQGIADGDVETAITVEELSDGNNDPIDADVGTASVTVVGSAPDEPVGDEDDEEDEGEDGDGSSDPDPAPDDGSDDGSNGDGGSSDSDGGDDAAGGDDAGGGADSGGDADDDGSDSVPGFGIGAAVTAVLAGTAARLARTGEDDGELEP